MKTIKVELESIDQAVEFCGVCNQFQAHVDLVSGKQTVDAKSVMGCINMVRRKLTVKLLSENEIAMKLFEKEMQKWKDND